MGIFFFYFSNKFKTKIVEAASAAEKERINFFIRDKPFNNIIYLFF